MPREENRGVELQLREDWIDQAIDDVGAEKVQEHLEELTAQIEKFHDETSANDIIYAQKAPMKKAVELLLKEYTESDEYGEHESQLLATAIILQQEIENAQI